jgi:mannitol-1-/sugar-/sorbitol-6-phosphatase
VSAPEAPATGSHQRLDWVVHGSVAAVLLDMDGTLVDSTAVVESMWRRFAARYGVDPTQILRYSHGRLTLDTVAAFLPEGHSVDQVAAALEAEQLQQLEGIVEVPDARRFLGELAEARVAVVTSAPRELAVRRLAAAGLPQPPVLVTAEDVEVGKPSPEGYLRAADALGCPVQDCAIFEDAEAGIQAALATTASTIVVGRHESSTTYGLRRIADFRAVRARLDEAGNVVICLAGQPPVWPRH